MDTRKIGIFDSGIGGLTVLKEMEKSLPNESFIYLGDTLNFPYGDKTKEEIIEFSKNNVKYLINQNVKVIVIACGTATSCSLEALKKEFDIPIIGIIEPTVMYIKKMNIEKIGVIATNGTIKNGAWGKTLKREIPKIKVYNQACPLLASIAEVGKIQSKESIDAIHNYMKIFKENCVDTIILGCTHYPLYDEIIEKEFDYNVNLINTGEIVAQNVKKYLKENNLQNDGKKEKNKIVISKEEEGFLEKAKQILEERTITYGVGKSSAT